MVSSSTFFVLDNRSSDTEGPEQTLASADFEFDSMKRSDGDRFFVFGKTILSSELGLDLLFEDCGEYAYIYATAAVDDSRRSVSIDAHVYSGGKEVMSFSDNISEEEFDRDSAYYYDGIFVSDADGPVLIGNATVDAVKNINSNVKYLKKVVDKISSSVLKEKIKKALANEIVKKVLKAAALSAIPFIGWATAVIRVGLLAYDIMEFAKLLQELRDEADRDLSTPHVLWNDGTNMRYRLPVNGYGGLELDLTDANNVNYSEKNIGDYYFAYMSEDNGYKIFISSVKLELELAMKIAGNPGPGLKEMNLCTLLESSAISIYRMMGAEWMVHLSAHKGNPGFYHTHHGLHDSVNYPAHVFFGEPIYSDIY
ncbi:hypothetical protein AUQ37_05340 [Candidatus Methanomethylophilus sp. 1R26]|nr:hypothetical protein AUQ37_05340 [Candidatus Methanomethylophilus sp. 1R26]